MNEEKKLVTCVYCGHEYPDQTPTHGAEILKEHIKVCEKHPMRESEQKIKKLRQALFALIGVETIEELIEMESMLKSTQFSSGITQQDKIVAINAIRVLIETAE